MEDQKEGAKKVLGMKSVLFVNAAILALAAWGFAGEYAHNRVLAEEISRLESRKTELATATSQLASLGEKLAAGDVLERDARTKLGLMKPGEEVVVVRGISSAPTAPIALVATFTDNSPKANAAQWWRYFFHSEI